METRHALNNTVTKIGCFPALNTALKKDVGHRRKVQCDADNGSASPHMQDSEKEGGGALLWPGRVLSEVVPEWPNVY